MIDELQYLFDLTFRKSEIVDYEIKKKEIPYLVKDIFKELSCWLAVAAVGTGCIFGLSKCANAEYEAQNSPEFVKKLQELEGTVVGKRIGSFGYQKTQHGFIYFALEDGKSARMIVPLNYASSDVRFNELEKGAKGSLQGFKDMFEPPKKEISDNFVRVNLIEEPAQHPLQLVEPAQR